MPSDPKAQKSRKTESRTEKLSTPKAKAAKAPTVGDYIIRDSENHALGLALRVYASGAKSWIVQRKLLGKPFRYVLGPFPLLNHAQAVSAALPIAQQLRKQIDPKLNEKHQRTETARLQAREKLTVGVAFQAYLDYAKGITRDAAGKPVGEPKPKQSTTSIRDIERAKALLAAGSLWAMPLEGLSGADLETELGRLKSGAIASTAKRGGATQAGRVMRLLRASVSRAYRQASIVRVNPFEQLSGLVPDWNPLTPRERIVASTETDLRKWWQAVEDLRSVDRPQATDSKTMADYMVLSLLLGGRSTETLSATWSNVNLESRTLTFPAAVTKNGKPLTIPFGDYAYALLKGRQEANKSAEVPSEYVFPSSRKPQNGERTHIKSPHKAIRRVSEASGIEFSPHDLRRTFASLLNELGVNSHILETALNHTPQDVAGKHYVRTRLTKLRHHYQSLEEQVLEEAGVKVIKAAGHKVQKSAQARNAQPSNGRRI